MIRYREGYNYQLAQDYSVATAIKPMGFVRSALLRLDTDGELYILAGYAWDGPSGPALDTPNFMRGSLVHDALYQLMCEGLLSYSWREAADQELRRVCLEDGMSAIRAWWVYQGVRFGGGPHARPSSANPVLAAP